MGEDGKPCECRGMEFLEDDPIADHVFDVVRHHRHRCGQQVDAAIGMAQGRE